MSINDPYISRIAELEGGLSRLLSAPVQPFLGLVPSDLPKRHGLYRIFDPALPDATIRAGRTKSAEGGLRQRIYNNHLMGDQDGNLPAQLVKHGACADSTGAKQLIRERFTVQYLLVEDAEERRWLEYFMLAVLRPRYCD